MKALKIACDEFLKADLDMQNFEVSISEEPNDNDDDDIFVVTFLGRLSAGKRGLGTANRVPGSVTYFISREKWTIVKEQGVR